MTHSMLQSDPLPPVSVTHSCMRRLFRSGVSPVLAATVSYPVLCPAEDGGALTPSVIRFNETYRALAEKLLDWAKGAPLATAEADFLGSGAAAAYRFDRRVLICDMEAAYAAEKEGDPPCFLTVTRTLRSGSRRGEIAERSLTAVDVWRWPELTLCAFRKNGMKFRKNI